MNTRTAVVTVALACLNLTAIALQSEDDPALFPAGQLLVASPGSGAIAAYDEGGGTLPQPVTGLQSPQDLAFASDGALFVSDADLDLVLVTDAGGTVLDALGGDSPLSQPAGLAFGPDGALFVASAGTDSVMSFDRSGAFRAEIGAADGLVAPWGVAFGPDGRLHVASSGSNLIAIFDPSGTLVDALDGGGALNAPTGLCFDGDGALWVSCAGNNRVLALDGQGAVLHSFDGDGQLDAPAGLVFGPDGLLYVACTGSQHILALDAAGHVIRVLALDGSAEAPRGLAFAPSLFKATLKGRMARPGEKDLKFSSKAILAYAPGSAGWSLRLLDADDALAAAWSSDTWVFHGRLAQAGPGAKVAVLGALQLGAASAQEGLTAAQLHLK
ncbi:MAG TPA: NHL repeat-containing protein, partial [Planctomycetota bacterium]|nr:NHL repeat-containing protein [Planctomycetota bacterium]